MTNDQQPTIPPRPRYSAAFYARKRALIEAAEAHAAARRAAEAAANPQLAAPPNWATRPGWEEWVLRHARLCAMRLGIDLRECCRRGWSVKHADVSREPNRSPRSVAERGLLVAEMRRTADPVFGVPSYPQIAAVLGMGHSTLVMQQRKKSKGTEGQRDGRRRPDDQANRRPVEEGTKGQRDKGTEGRATSDERRATSGKPSDLVTRDSLLVTSGGAVHG